LRRGNQCTGVADTASESITGQAWNGSANDAAPSAPSASSASVTRHASSLARSAASSTSMPMTTISWRRSPKGPSKSFAMSARAALSVGYSSGGVAAHQIPAG